MSRDVQDLPLLRAHVGRFVQRYFPAYGVYIGKVTEIIPERFVCLVVYEDGDEEELFMDQLATCVQPESFIPPSIDTMIETGNTLGYTWPPPSLSNRLIIRGQRPRKQAIRLQDITPHPQPRRQSRRTASSSSSSKRSSASRAQAKRASSAPELAEGDSEQQKKEHKDKEQQHRQAKQEQHQVEQEQKQEQEQEQEHTPEQSSLSPRPALSYTLSDGQLLHGGNSAAFRVRVSHPKKFSKQVKVLLPPTHQRIGDTLRLQDARIFLDSYLDAGRPIMETIDLRDPLVPEKQASSQTAPPLRSSPAPPSEHAVLPRLPADNRKNVTTVAASSSTASKNKAKVKQKADKKRIAGSSRKQDKMSHDSEGAGDAHVHAERASIASLTPTTHSSITDAEEEDPQRTQPRVRKRWSGSTTVNMFCALKARCELRGDLPQPTCAGAAVQSEEEAFQLTRAIYRMISKKLEVTCGADGRYGITGCVTQASMAKLLLFLQSECQLDASASFIDLGHGMGRPTFHAACLYPPIRASLGTEYNPQLYKQSMHALQEATATYPHFQATPRVFFMDHNLKDFTSLNGLSHVYVFNIGMPADVINHILKLVEESIDVKFLIIYTHGAATPTRISALGTIVKNMSMCMPGRRSYEAVVVRVRQSGHAAMDVDVDKALEMLRQPALYKEYVAQLGTVLDRETEELTNRMSRASRSSSLSKQFFSLSPHFQNIPLGFVRNICLELGVGTRGRKEDLLANLQNYVPSTFSLSLLAVGSDYDDDTVAAVLDKLLEKTPARRQPELTS